MAREPIKIPRRLVELLCAGGEYADYGLYRQDGSWWGTWTVNGRRRHEAIEADNAEDAATWLVAIVSRGGILATTWLRAASITL